MNKYSRFVNECPFVTQVSLNEGLGPTRGLGFRVLGFRVYASSFCNILLSSKAGVYNNTDREWGK